MRSLYILLLSLLMLVPLLVGGYLYYSKKTPLVLSPPHSLLLSVISNRL